MVGWLVKCDFITPSGTSDPGLDSESKFEQSVAKVPNFFVPPPRIILNLGKSGLLDWTMIIMCQPQHVTFDQMD